MMHCVDCNSAIDEHVQHYIASDMGPEIISVIEQNIGHEVDVNAAICSQCFGNITRAISADSEISYSNRVSPHPSEEYELQNHYDTNVCIRCRVSLFRRRAHSLPEGPERDFISEEISPREIPHGGLVCYACWVYTQNRLQQQRVIIPPVIDLNTCVWCQRSLAITRRHSIPEGPERDEIIRRIHPREIPPGGLVCYACWVSARRNVERERQQNPDPSHHHRDSICAWCGMSLHRRQTRLLSIGPERDEVAARIYPNELPEHALLCTNCWGRAQENVQIEQGDVLGPLPNQPINNSVNLNQFARTSNSSDHCFVPECRNQERNRVPLYVRKIIIKTQKVFVTENARVCNEHKTIYNWEFLEQHEFSNNFTTDELESMLTLSLQVQDSDQIQFQFHNIDAIEDNFFRFWTGVTKENYNIMYDHISPALTCKRPKTALGVWLIKARTGESHERIASLLCLSKSTITRLLQAAREALLSAFVPIYLGINQITRQEIINRNLIIPEGLFGNREERVPIVICDGTYIYLQKSSNYLFQKKTYSLHKYRNLVKPFLLVASDGYIIDILGPYSATESDADIMKALFQNENGPFRAFFQPNDVFILDRGFRDAIPMLQSLGYNVYKPEALEAGETQLPTIRANKSRCVTLCRWVVEVVNGRFKRDFKLLRQEYFNLAATHLMDDVRICAAIINAFHPVLVDRPDAEVILSRALQRREMPNLLADLIITNRINRFRAQFTRIDGELPELDTFPEMAMSDLTIFALGIYQIKQARSYFGEHIRQHGTFQVEVSSELEVVAQAVPSQLDPVLIRGRIKSRHISGRTYYTYILLSREGSSWDERIVSYYCTCVSGQRTVGCCAHTMTIIWYLGWARHQDNIAAPASFLDGILVRDDIENEN